MEEQTGPQESLTSPSDPLFIVFISACDEASFLTIFGAQKCEQSPSILGTCSTPTSCHML